MSIKNKIKSLIIFVFVLSLVFPHISHMYLTNSIFDDLKYLIVFLNIGICCIYFFICKTKTFKYRKEFLNVIIIVSTFFLISLIFSFIFNKPITFRTIVELLYLFIPALYTFCIINCLNIDEINNSMKCVLIICFLLWIIEVGIFNFTLENLCKIDFINSFSPFESFIFADISLVSFCFFLYTKHIENKKNILPAKVAYYISFIFVLFTFKRVAVLFSIIIFVLDLIIDLRKPLHVNVIRITKLIFFISTLVYTWLLLGDNSKILYQLIGFDLDKFTVGRQWYLSLVELNGYTFGPYGSSTLTLESMLGPGKYLEMDLVKITIELGIVAVFLFINNYWNLISNNIISYIIMFMVFVNLLFSHSFTNPFTWTIRLLTFAIITIYEKGEKEQYE